MSNEKANSSKKNESGAHEIDADKQDMMEDAAVGYYGNFGLNQPSFAEQAPTLAKQSKQKKTQAKG